MTMPFRVQGPAPARRRQRRATSSTPRLWCRQAMRGSRASRAPGRASRCRADAAAPHAHGPPLEPGAAVPDASFIDQDGRALQMASLARPALGTDVRLHPVSAADVLPHPRSPVPGRAARDRAGCAAPGRAARRRCRSIRHSIARRCSRPMPRGSARIPASGGSSPATTDDGRSLRRAVRPDRRARHGTRRGLRALAEDGRDRRREPRSSHLLRAPTGRPRIW